MSRSRRSRAARAAGRAPAGLDVATSGLTLVVEDRAQRPLVTAELAGADFEPTTDGWRSTANVPGLDRLVVRRRGDGVVVWLRGTIPPFDLTTPASGDPSLTWRIAFGADCADSHALTCNGDARGNARCRAAGGHPPREP